MSSVFSLFFRERSFESRQNAGVGFFFYRQENTSRIQNGVFPFTVAEFCG